MTWLKGRLRRFGDLKFEVMIVRKDTEGNGPKRVPNWTCESDFVEAEDVIVV